MIAVGLVAEEGAVNVFAEAMLDRVRASEGALATALEADDVYAVAAAQDELDDAVRLARAHGLVTEAAEAGER